MRSSGFASLKEVKIEMVQNVIHDNIVFIRRLVIFNVENDQFRYFPFLSPVSLLQIDVKPSVIYEKSSVVH